MKDDGSNISNRKIASRFIISENCIRNTLKIFKRTGFNQLESKKKLRSVRTVIGCQERANPRLIYHALQ